MATTSNSDLRARLALGVGSAPAAPAPLPLPRRRASSLSLADLQAKRDLRAKAQKKLDDFGSGGDDSFFGKIGQNIEGVGGLVTGFVPGMLHLADSAINTIAGVPRLGVDIVTGRAADYDTFGKVLDEYLPLVSEVGGGLQQTGQNIRHPSRYLDAWNRGEIGPVLVNDLSNASMVAAPLAKGLTMASKTATAPATAARLESAASVASKVQHLTGQAGNAPFTASGQVAKSSARAGMDFAAGKVAAGFTKALEKDGLVGNAARGTRERLGLYVTPEGKIGLATAKAQQRLGGRVVAAYQRTIHELADTVKASPAEEGAALAMLNNVGHLDYLANERAAAAGLNLLPEDVRRLHTLENHAEQTYTSDIQAVVHAYKSGTMDDAARARVDALMEGSRKIIRERLEAPALVGEGHRRPLAPEQLGNDPMDPYVVQELRKVEGLSDADIDTLMGWRQQGVSWYDIEAALIDDLPQLQDILDNPLVYPKPWRASLMAAKTANQAGDASIGATYGLNLPIRPNEMLAAGIPEPTYLPGGKSKLAAPPRYASSDTTPASLGLRGVRGVGSDQMARANELHPYSLRVLAEMGGKTLRSAEFDRVIVDMARNDKLPTVATMLGRQVLDEIQNRATRIADATVNGRAAGVLDTHGPAAKIKLRESDAYKTAYGQAVIDALAEQGYEVLPGNKVNPEIGDFDPATLVDNKAIDETLIVLPKGVKARLRTVMVPKDMNLFLKGLGFVNRKFKGAVLPFSIRWQLGDMVGGAFMAWAGGGIPPSEMIRSMLDIKNLTSDGRMALLDHPDFVSSGLNNEGLKWLNDSPDAPQPKTPFGKFQRKSYKFNESINRVNRQGYLLAKVERLLDERGLALNGPRSISAVDALGKWDDPMVQDVISEAVADANKVMGTFDELTPFEQRWMKNVFPFYVWSRHITMLAARTAIDNPARIVWMLRLGSYGLDTQDLPEWLKGSITIPDGAMPDFIAGGDVLMPTNFLNPFNDVVGNPAITPQGMMRSLNPAIKVGLAGGLGVEPGNSFAEPLRKITRPYGEDRNMFRDALAAGLRTFPVTREAQYLLPTGTVGGLSFGPHPRYNSGRNMVDKDGNPIDTNSRALAPLRLIGLPVPTPMSDAEAIQKSQAKANVVKARKRKKIKLG